MNNYNYKSIVSNTEAEALKEMIFKRARERAEALAEDTKTSYTSAVHADIMDLARNSLVKEKNPFIIDVEPKKDEIIEKPVDEELKEPQKIGFSQRKVNEINSRIVNNRNTSTEKIAGAEVQSTMLEARDCLYKKQSFVGALEFLNSQATITLIKNKGEKFEALA